MVTCVLIEVLDRPPRPRKLSNHLNQILVPFVRNGLSAAAAPKPALTRRTAPHHVLVSAAIRPLLR